MTSATTLCSAALLCACVLSVAAQQRGSSAHKYDNIDIDKILSSKRLVGNYVGCLLDKKPCPPEGQDLKKDLPEAIRTKCAKCTESQKQKAIKVFHKMQKDYPQEWKQMTDKWDPKGNLMKEFEEEVKKTQG